MPKVSKESASQAQEIGPVSERSEDLDGYTVNFLTFNDDVDGEALLKGLPDDRCQCPHWGYVVKGTFTVRFADREEVYEAGDAFYMPPGHIPDARRRQRDHPVQSRRGAQGHRRGDAAEHGAAAAGLSYASSRSTSSSRSRWSSSRPRRNRLLIAKYFWR